VTGRRWRSVPMGWLTVVLAALCCAPCRAIVNAPSWPFAPPEGTQTFWTERRSVSVAPGPVVPALESLADQMGCRLMLAGVGMPSGTLEVTAEQAPRLDILRAVAAACRRIPYAVGAVGALGSLRQETSLYLGPEGLDLLDLAFELNWDAGGALALGSGVRVSDLSPPLRERLMAVAGAEAGGAPDELAVYLAGRLYLCFYDGDERIPAQAYDFPAPAGGELGLMGPPDAGPPGGERLATDGPGLATAAAEALVRVVLTPGRIEQDPRFAPAERALREATGLDSAGLTVSATYEGTPIAFVGPETGVSDDVISATALALHGEIELRGPVRHLYPTLAANPAALGLRTALLSLTARWAERMRLEPDPVAWGAVQPWPPASDAPREVAWREYEALRLSGRLPEGARRFRELRAPRLQWVPVFELRVRGVAETGDSLGPGYRCMVY